MAGEQNPGKRFVKGLFKDTSRMDQPKNTWRYAKNMIMTNKEGSISNEGGNTLSGHLGEDPDHGAQTDKVIGAIEVNNDRVILFIVGISTVPGAIHRSEIGVWENGTYTVLFNPDISIYPKHTLNFQTSNPIEGTFKIDPKEDLIIYWTDDLNPPRAFNVSRQERWLASSGSPSITWLYGIDPSTTPNPNHIELLNLFPNSGPIPNIDIHDIYWVPRPYQKSIIEGGGLRTGVYYLSLAYVDDDFVATNYLTVSNPVSIVEEFDHTLPTQKKDGAKEGDQTTKAIKWRATKLNTDYKYLRPAVIRKMGEATDVYKLSDVEIPESGSKSIVFSGIEGFTSGSVEEIMIDTTSYETAKTINQLDGVLYLGNVTGTKDVGYQKYANNIKLKSYTVEIPRFDEYFGTVDNLESGFGTSPVNIFGQNTSASYQDPSKSYRYVPNATNWKGYMRDEIYAFYIAFIMNDGSMSYAYHIPGREDLGDEKEPLDSLNPTNYGGLWGDFQDISPGYAKRFHFIDSYSDAISGTSYDVNTYMGMNFWENATEFYPSSEDYEVWSNTGQIGTIQGLNVRHHHFPSNKNKDVKRSITSSECETDQSQGTTSMPEPWDGYLIFSNTNEAQPYSCASSPPSAPVKFRFNNSYERDQNYWQGSNDNNMAQALWHGRNKFIADQPMQVTVDWNVWFRQPWGSNVKDVVTTLRTDSLAYMATSTTGTKINDETIGSFGTGSGCGGNQHDFNGKNATGAPWGTYTINLQAGEALWIDTHLEENGTACTDGTTIKQSTSGQINCYPDPGNVPENANMANYEECGDDVVCVSYIRFKVESSSTLFDPENLSDVKLSHTVNRLGFNLEDIKIPESIADKVQGFKIYYAKKNHANRTILGQSPLLPALRKRAQLGICAEAGNDPSAQRVMSTLQTTPEDFWAMDPYPRTWWDYPKYSTVWYHQGTLSGAPQFQDDAEGYKVFSFHDFYLLRTKNSLATATHIDLQYNVRNLVFNGPGLDQNKKMLSIVQTDTDDDGNEIKTIEETWGWETAINCYSQSMRSAIFLGCEYDVESYKNLPRILGQKAKTYLMGDTIFKGAALGFGGKLFNEYGESSIALGLKDLHELRAETYRAYRNSAPGSNGVPSTFIGNMGNYGEIQIAAPPLLVNPLDASGNMGNGGNRSKLPIVNLKAFKTDLYKSIDNQDLVWTGFEVTGSDLDNFIFDNTGNPLEVTYNDTYNNVTEPSDYSTWTLQKKIQSDSNNNAVTDSQLGIFGGDTFICRYGFVTTLTPSDNNTPSQPEKSIHYQIVETTDNINFRHAESDKSAYFPNSIAKTLLREAGAEDYTHVDNLKYNDNYSELNDIRPAFPLPLRESKQDNFPTRTHRSAKHDTTNLIDNYRIFLANQFKDLPKNRGDLWKLSSFNNLMYFHMQESLFAAQGKQTMQMGDKSEAFIGSGDIFAQEPQEIIQTEGGYGGTQSQWAALVTRNGYFFVDVSTRKVFMMADNLMNISDLGMKSWFRDNLKFSLEDYGLTPNCLDNPIDGFGLHSIWDPKHKRILLTKRDIAPTKTFIDGFNGVNAAGNPLPIVAGAANPPGLIIKNPNGCNFQRFQQKKNSSVYHWADLWFGNTNYFTKSESWTVSYYPELQVWISFHDYFPYLYFNTSTNFYSLTDEYTIITDTNAPTLGTDFGNAGIWEHNANIKGVLYQEADVYPNVLNPHAFEFEFIHNEYAASDTLCYNFGYTAEVFGYNRDEDEYTLDILQHGFTSFYLYNTFQISGDKESSPLEYLINVRRVGSEWKVNRFRDMAAITLDTGDYYTPTGINVIGGANTGTITSSSTVPMFTVVGMNEDVSANYLNLAKTWDIQKKFIDKWIGIRLIYDNIENNLVNLYSTTVGVRMFYR
tara:strand:+ start:6388 stop:12009 length:5622 start_codon:yes stop_codon:yes gene_type:complete